MSAQPLTKDQLRALTLWMEDVTATLCYLPEIPQAHKVDMVQALGEWHTAIGLKQPNVYEIVGGGV